MIKLYGVIRSRSNRPHWVLEEIGVPYEFYQLDFTKGDNRSEHFLDLNPSGKMPVLVDGDFVLTESAAICTYLGEKYPESGLVPTGAVERANYNRWMSFVISELEQPLWTAGKHKFALPEEHRVAEIFPTTQYEFAKAAELLKQAMQGEYFLGDSFTILDIMIAHTLRWANRFKFELDDTLTSFMERMESRDAFQRMLATKTLEIPR